MSHFVGNNNNQTRTIGYNNRENNSQKRIQEGYKLITDYTPTKNIIYSEMQGAESVWRYDVDNKLVKTIQPLQERELPDFRFNWNTPAKKCLDVYNEVTKK